MQKFQNSLVGGKYWVGPKIGSGSFGEVYLAYEEGQAVIYALKKELSTVKNPTLELEAYVLKTLKGIQGFPNLEWFGVENHSSIMVMNLLGPSLEDLLVLCGRRFTLRTGLLLADQILHKIEILHSKNFIHRDLKPENFMMGIGKESHIVNLIDFGLSRKYRDEHTKEHISYKQNRPLTGTARYSSINAHLGIEQSRRDDLEAIGYVLVYFLQGSLHWQGITANNLQEKYEKIMEKKMSVPVEIQCKGLPIEFATYLNYCRSLKFEEKPDYTFLRKMFRELYCRISYPMDYGFDWTQFTEPCILANKRIRMEVKPKGQQFNFVSPQSLQKVDFNECLSDKEIIGGINEEPEERENDQSSLTRRINQAEDEGNIPEEWIDESSHNLRMFKNHALSKIEENNLEMFEF